MGTYQPILSSSCIWPFIVQNEVSQSKTIIVRVSVYNPVSTIDWIFSVCTDSESGVGHKYRVVRSYFNCVTTFLTKYKKWQYLLIDWRCLTMKLYCQTILFCNYLYQEGGSNVLPRLYRNHRRQMGSPSKLDSHRTDHRIYIHHAALRIFGQLYSNLRCTHPNWTI